MKKIQLILVVLVLLVSSQKMYGQTNAPRADARQKTQHGRIHEGRKDGEVTNREARALHKEQRHIRRSERRVKSDGQVTAREKARLERKQDRASRHIRRSRNNNLEKKE